MALLAVGAPPAGAKLIWGSMTDPVGDVGLDLAADVKQLDVLYDDAGGNVDFRVTLNQPPVGGDVLRGTLRLGQTWDGDECVTSSAPFDLSLAGSWTFRWGGTATPFEPWGQVALVEGNAFLSAVGAPDGFGIGTWIGTTLRATATGGASTGDAYKGRKFVCAGDFELVGVNQGREHRWSAADAVGDFPLVEGDPPPPVPAPGVIGVASPLILDKDEYKPGELMTATVVWRNLGGSSVTARHLGLSVRPATAPGMEAAVGNFEPALDFRTLTPGQSVDHTSNFRIPAGMAPGRWILWASWQDTSEVWHGVATLPFTIRSAQGQPGTPVGPRVIATLRSRRLGRALRHGLVLAVELSVAGRVKITAQLSRRQAKRLGLARTIGSGSASFADDGRRNVRVRFTKAARRALARRSKLTITLKIQATGESGERRVITRRVTLRR